MITHFVLALALLALAPVPTPSPDPHTYSDLAMNFRAPDNMLLLGRKPLPLKALTGQMQIVAVWRTQPGKGRDWVITLAMESFPGRPNPAGWDTSYENELREQIDGLFVRGKTPTTLKNGMPAMFLDLSYGEGFNSRKQFAYVWNDGERGVSLSITGGLGDITTGEAKKALAETNAVLYPIDREGS